MGFFGLQLRITEKAFDNTLSEYLVANYPLSKWAITPIISGLTLLIPFITGVITHLLSGMSHQIEHVYLYIMCVIRRTSFVHLLLYPSCGLPPSPYVPWSKEAIFLRFPKMGVPPNHQF